ncbi:nucleotide-diphospho-sugar transferase [Fimicolochytrium jonesii]|uniref:nucleotide-diphospho-sugar transferase n=1 Tax=Fimicolochytrium jonesii TaxID=1396493 RepID=UPI0022FF437B|nr:nucleotide-diphospho-sugar transferase [Fimicolochytrium jonesii]KAI8820845.1 nucleotide-diphospho-sugar transferase [Fimicolochytrium jonesii]
MAPQLHDHATLLKRFTDAGQGHVFAFWDALSQNDRAELLDNLAKIDVDRVNRIFKKATAPTDEAAATAAKDELEPLPEAAFASTIGKANEAKVASWYNEGLKLIAQNKVAVILLAGGQGTRLGSSDPKGCYDIGLPSKKSLFQLQAERIIRLQKVAAKAHSKGTENVVIPWYIMVSGPTREATTSYFRKHNFFGLDPENVMFFEQGVLPAFDPTGKIFMETKSTPALAPDGNGGIYAALRREGVLADLERRQIPYVHTYCVDNCLVKVADPVFIGYCVGQDADCGAKAVPKASANESVGVICLRSGKFAVVEYSEIPPAIAEATRPDDPSTLLYNAANIANHFYTTAFLNRVDALEAELDYHVAHKKIKHVDTTTGEKVSPSQNNGVKLELFIFDVFPFTQRMAVLEVPRNDEFSPLKNAPGAAKPVDSPETSRAHILDQCVRWARAAGATVVSSNENEKEDPPVLEISPLVSYGGEGLEAYAGKTIFTPTILA